MSLQTVSDVLGNTKQVIRTYEDGSVDCPFCTYAIRFPPGHCDNPWCIANPAMPTEAAQKIIHEAQERERAETERARNHESAMKRINADNEARDRFRNEAESKARETGACVACLRKSGFRKYVKHRDRCPIAGTTWKLL